MHAYEVHAYEMHAHNVAIPLGTSNPVIGQSETAQIVLVA